MNTKLKDDVGPEDFGINAQDAEKARNYAAFLVAAERERCAKVCEAQLDEPASREWNMGVKCCAAAVRSRA